ncbi:MAG TPA: aldehyde ferredoxin oxidoreductase N-terminal domain-containing protein, partial [Bacillota bacterium]|nr:aldehyde ferredoxin oxidoreductase N-terminal domain-containing protein [Bacillota bacterium]
MKRILRLDMGALRASYEEVPEKWLHLWGRGLTSRVVADEVDPGCYALGKKNKVVLAPGPLAGFAASSTGRISVGGKSPLTGGIKEANGGGTTAWKMGRLGLKAVIVEGKPQDGGTFIAVVNKDGAEVIEAPELRLKGIFEAAESLKEKYGKNIGLAIIGPAGEMLLTASGISHMDTDGVPSRFTARGGLGAVMGSKGLKAIVFDDRGAARPDVAKNDEFMAALKAYNQAVLEAPSSAGFRKLGTANLVRGMNAIGALPTKNFSRGTFDKFEEISAEKLRATIEQRGGNPEHACMPGCTIACSNVYVDKEGKMLVSPLEYETIGLVGSNCMIGSLDDIARINREANDLGLDTIDLGGAIGVAMEAGLIGWGDAEAALGLLAEVRKGSVLGRLIGSGGAIVGKV